MLLDYSIPYDVIEFFDSPNPSSRTLTLGVDLSSDRNEYLRVKRVQRIMHTTSEPIVCKVWEPWRLRTL
jgi:hypothetical protein